VGEVVAALPDGTLIVSVPAPVGVDGAKDQILWAKL
jgi:hypothetical protein